MLFRSDSTLALLVATRAFDRLQLDRSGIVGVTMPGFGTTDRTHDNAVTLMKALGVAMREISIVPAVNLHFQDIGHDPSVHDVTYENSQARQRTLLLMDIANQSGGMVLGTGDLSELALGWATYNGDHMSMYGVNAGVPKTLVRHLTKYFASQTSDPDEKRALLDIVDTPISPELIPAEPDGTIKQKTEDLVGPYELHDFFLYYTLRYGFSPRRIFVLARKAFDGAYSDAVIAKWLVDIPGQSLSDDIHTASISLAGCDIFVHHARIFMICYLVSETDAESGIHRVAVAVLSGRIDGPIINREMDNRHEPVSIELFPILIPVFTRNIIYFRRVGIVIVTRTVTVYVGTFFHLIPLRRFFFTFEDTGIVDRAGCPIDCHV